MRVNISQADKVIIIKKITRDPAFVNYLEGDRGTIISFLELIWDLRGMPSTDNRFSNARDDIWKHIVMNDDITFDELFIDRLDLSSIENSPYFEKFVNAVVHPSVIENDDRRNGLIKTLNILLKQHNYKLVISDYFEDKPVFQLRNEHHSQDLPADIIQNNIPFYMSGNEIDKPYPYFVLKSEDWNDWFKWETKFNLTYFKSGNEPFYIGSVKIMQSEEPITKKSIQNVFTFLDDHYCSLGQSFEYYTNLKYYLPNTYQSVLYALKDAAMSPRIFEKFNEDPIFNNSLLRDRDAKDVISQAKFKVNNIDQSNYYKFSFSFAPPYCIDKKEETVIVDFDFVYTKAFNHRIFGIIGKNGVGKTSFLSNLANSLSSSNPKNIIPHKPIFNKVITISYSFFDKLPLPEANTEFNYKYLGLRDIPNDEDIDDVIKSRFINALEKINKLELAYLWSVSIRKVLHSDILDDFFGNDLLITKIEIPKIAAKCKHFSSGENLLLYIITNIISEIQNNTLILFDEPETHLHPNAISQLMYILNKILEEFNSFCIIGTHSPLVIQEISSRDIKVFERNKRILEVKMLGHETFAENLTTITDEVFGNREVSKYNYDTLRDMVIDMKMTYEDIISTIKNDVVPIPLNIHLYLKGLLNEKPKTL